jgi:RES domain
VELETSVVEVAFHKRRFLEDARLTGQYTFNYKDFLADFSGQFHFLDSNESQACLQPDPIPQCYVASQALAHALLYAGSNGIVYPSVRHSSGTCIECFRPALISDAGQTPAASTTKPFTIRRTWAEFPPGSIL